MSRRILENEVLLNLMSHSAVSWAFIKLSAASKFVRLFV